MFETLMQYLWNSKMSTMAQYTFKSPYILISLQTINCRHLNPFKDPDVSLLHCVSMSWSLVPVPMSG